MVSYETSMDSVEMVEDLGHAIWFISILNSLFSFS